ncbi:MAG TPA: amidohydrolase family protein [Vicinamibacteria bacterium]|nr:amidohydrolase family protein [Vicinamibacteria bacterium]
MLGNHPSRLRTAALVAAALAGLVLAPTARSAQAQQKAPGQILLKDYRPVSLYRVPVTNVQKARYPVIDMHSHPYVKTPEDVDRWVKAMDETGIEKTVILTKAHGAEFDRLVELFSRHPTRFELWCGLDYTGFDQPGYGPAAVAELERCARKGARGIGEEGDKGLGMDFGKAKGLHFDDARIAPLLERCADLGLPVVIHVADPIWMYQKMDETNDGLMNAVNWRLDDKPGIVDHAGMIAVLERAVRAHPRTTFVACHFANLDYDLARLGQLLDTLPNLYADISARYAETATIPRFAASFIGRYQDRLVYGTDMGTDPSMYRLTFRILETLDEHFYAPIFDYHWSYSGFGLEDAVLKKLYRENALAVARRAAANRKEGTR